MINNTGFEEVGDISSLIFSWSERDEENAELSIGASLQVNAGLIRVGVGLNLVIQESDWAEEKTDNKTSKMNYEIK